MLTATERAEAMALQVLISARLHNDRVVTHDVVDGVMSRDADKEQGKANKETVRRVIRARGALENVRVIFTEVERYWAIREQLHHMSGDEVHALRDSITEGGDDDPRGWDKALNDAISVRMSNRLAPARLYDRKPVSIRLWREPRPEEQHDRAADDNERDASELLGDEERWVEHFRVFGRQPQVEPVDRASALGTIVWARGEGWQCYRAEAGGVNLESTTGESSYWLEPVTEERPAVKETTLADVKARRRAVGFAAKWWAEQHTEEPTDEALRATFAHCVKPPRPESYPAIREAIAAEMPPAAAAPLFAALAAHESVRDAFLSRALRDLHTVACHLETLPLAAPTGLHSELREARDAVEEVWEALRMADSLTTRNAAYDNARTAIERARTVVLAVAPRAHRMHGTDMPATVEEIRAAALAYNAVEGAPEELSAVESGTPAVRVHCRSDSGTGWTVTATITAGVGSPVGHIPAHPPIVVKFRKRDGRKDAAENARRMFGHMFRVAVPVEYVTDRRV
ncbi:hypothetical protein ACPCVO_45275 [Streptomyces umbrinus]|uniref:hypothetical protein n=1 Tax=Streptomyces umbrinus TaxID=67370 RepID=UPI003C2E1CCE